MPGPTGGEVSWLVKFLASLAGMALSVAVWHPGSFWAGIRRMVICVVTGVAFGPHIAAFVSEYVGGVTEMEALIGGCVAAAAIAWPAWGRVSLYIDQLAVKKGKRNGNSDSNRRCD